MIPALAGGFFTTSDTWEAQRENKAKVLVVQLCPTLGPHGLQLARLLCP